MRGSLPVMRTFSCFALGFALGACQQTDPAAARRASGAAGLAVDADAKTSGGALAPEASRDAVTGFNTGKRLFKPTSFSAESSATSPATPAPTVSPRDTAPVAR
jgi:hypothetical protein